MLIFYSTYSNIYVWIKKILDNISKKIRVIHNVSQRELAKNVGVDFTYFSKIENGKLEPPAEDTIKKLAD